MSESFSIIQKIITDRRTVKPAQMNGGKIPDEQVRSLLQLAHWAPTHGRTEPWRFIVFANDAAQGFCQQHAELYKNNATNFIQGTYDNLGHLGDKASHIIITIMERGNLPKIPVMEETAATAAAIQNILLGAEALGLASFWSTGGMALQPAMHEFLQLRDEDFVMGILYLGYTDTLNPAVRNSTWENKVVWNG
jgi:nitroreductase